jgi:methylenetetrahydrofolate dehydrogenase (NADP+)/methenyltetrahydrofolate cyclohydrolase
MAAIVIDGNEIAAKVKEKLRERISILKGRGVTPRLAVILIGEQADSVSYVKGKQKALAEAGMEAMVHHFPETAAEAEVLSRIAALNADAAVHGILVQHPWPSHMRDAAIINALDPAKDVDCFHPANLGKLFLGEGGFLPGTPNGIIVMLRELGIPLSGKHAVVVGRSNIVGKPLALLLARREQNATVTLCHTGTVDLASHTRRADILVAACRSPGLIRGDMIKKGAAVIDVGVNRVPDSSKKKGYRLVGDVNFEEALDAAGWITKVPGGVGPMTITMLMQNLVQAAEANG